MAPRDLEVYEMEVERLKAEVVRLRKQAEEQPDNGAGWAVREFCERQAAHLDWIIQRDEELS